jgi:hypothetical protein
MAAYYPPHLEDFARLRLPRILERVVFVRLATWGTLLIETSLGTLVWIRELRYPVLFAGVLLHLGLELLLNLQRFGWTMLATFILFVPPDDMRWIVGTIVTVDGVRPGRC